MGHVKGRSVSFSEPERPQGRGSYFAFQDLRNILRKKKFSEQKHLLRKKKNLANKNFHHPLRTLTHLNPHAIINNPTMTVQCEIPPTHLINTQCKQCLSTHGPSLSINIHTISNNHNACSYIALICLLYDD